MDENIFFGFLIVKYAGRHDSRIMPTGVFYDEESEKNVFIQLNAHPVVKNADVSKPVGVSGKNPFLPMLPKKTKNLWKNLYQKFFQRDIRNQRVKLH